MSRRSRRNKRRANTNNHTNSNHNNALLEYLIAKNEREIAMNSEISPIQTIFTVGMALIVITGGICGLLLALESI